MATLKELEDVSSKLDALSDKYESGTVDQKESIKTLRTELLQKAPRPPCASPSRLLIPPALRATRAPCVPLARLALASIPAHGSHI